MLGSPRVDDDSWNRTDPFDDHPRRDGAPKPFPYSRSPGCICWVDPYGACLRRQDSLREDQQAGQWDSAVGPGGRGHASLYEPGAYLRLLPKVAGPQGDGNRQGGLRQKAGQDGLPYAQPTDRLRDVPGTSIADGVSAYFL